MSEKKTEKSWANVRFEFERSVGLVLWLLAGRQLPETPVLSWGDLWGALIVIRHETWADKIRDQILGLLLKQAKHFEDYNRISNVTVAGSEIFDRAIAEMMAKAESFAELTDIYNTIIGVSGGKDKRIPIVLRQMANLPNLNFRVTVEIIKRASDKRIVSKLRQKLEAELPALNFSQLHDLIFANYDPVAQKAIELASELAETFEELRLLVHSAIHLGRGDIKTRALSRMSRHSDVDLAGILRLFGYNDWSTDEECINLIIQWVEERVDGYLSWYTINQARYGHTAKPWVKHVLDRMLELANTPEDLIQCLNAYDQYDGYKQQVFVKMVQLI